MKDIETFESRSVTRRAKAHLKQDPKMSAIIDRVGAFKPGCMDSTFEALVRSIIHQQISMKAAASIRERVRRLCPQNRFTAKNLAAVPEADLRGAGLSPQKHRYIRSICEHFLDGSIKPARLKSMNDDDVIESLTAITGVGVWTAEMILMFNLKRCDVWPIDDLGLRHALKKTYRIPMDARRDRLIKFGQRFTPYRSVATWYLWRSLDAGVLPGIS